MCFLTPPHDHVFAATRLIFTILFVRVTYVRRSVLLWWRSDTLCTSGFMYNVIAHAASGLAMK